MEAALKVPKGSLICFATDGLFCNALIADIGLGPDLGDWELKNEKDGVVEPFSLELYQSGCYALYGPDGKIRDNRFRGLARKDVDWELLRYLWRRHKTSGSVTLPSKRFIGHRTALQMNKPELQCTWSDTPKVVRLQPGNGIAALPCNSIKTGKNIIAWEAMWYGTDYNIVSTRYRKLPPGETEAEVWEAEAQP